MPGTDTIERYLFTWFFFSNRKNIASAKCPQLIIQRNEKTKQEKKIKNYLCDMSLTENGNEELPPHHYLRAVVLMSSCPPVRSRPYVLILQWSSCISKIALKIPFQTCFKMYITHCALTIIHGFITKGLNLCKYVSFKKTSQNMCLLSVYMRCTSHLRKLNIRPGLASKLFSR